MFLGLEPNLNISFIVCLSGVNFGSGWRLIITIMDLRWSYRKGTGKGHFILSSLMKFGLLFNNFAEECESDRCLLDTVICFSSLFKVHIQALNIRVSYHDARLFLAIMNSLPAQMLQTENEQKEDLSTKSLASSTSKSKQGKQISQIHQISS